MLREESAKAWYVSGENRSMKYAMRTPLSTVVRSAVLVRVRNLDRENLDYCTRFLGRINRE